MKAELLNAVAVGAGAIMGALARWQVGETCKRYDVSPWGTAGLNIVGSFLLGAITSNGKFAWADGTVTPQAKNLYLMLGTGFCGSFTTFSTYSVDTVLFLMKILVKIIY